MIITFKDNIQGVDCFVTVDAKKKGSRILSLEGIEQIPPEIEKIYLDNCNSWSYLYSQYSNTEIKDFFRGRPMKDPRLQLRLLYEKWNYFFEHGTDDINWPDGVGLNTVRKDIIIYRKVMEETCMPYEYSDFYYLNVPELMDSNFMSNSDQLKKNALLYAEKLVHDEVFISLVNISHNTEDIYKTMCFGEKYGVLRNIHWIEKLPERIKSMVASNDLRPLKKYKLRLSYEAFMEEFKEQLQSVKALPTYKESWLIASPRTQNVCLPEKFQQLTFEDILDFSNTHTEKYPSRTRGKAR